MEQTHGTGSELPNLDELLNLPPLQAVDLGRVAEGFLEKALSDWEITSVELRVLSVCAANPGTTAVEISRVIPVDPPAVSRVVHQLSQRGLLSRRRSRTDRREVRLRATPSGLALLTDCQPLLEQAAADFLADLNEAQARSFLRAVATLLSANS